ncbi:PAS domain S-box protein [Candidatus Woesearchaeota archaeon]|nr:PAS domain S-box protein [Candidatus Woesearchaeota archaeon]
MVIVDRLIEGSEPYKKLERERQKAEQSLAVAEKEKSQLQQELERTKSELEAYKARQHINEFEIDFFIEEESKLLKRIKELEAQLPKKDEPKPNLRLDEQCMIFEAESLSELLGYDSSDLVGKKLSDLGYSDEDRQFMSYIPNLAYFHMHNTGQEVCFKKKDGSSLALKMNMEIYSEGKKFRGCDIILEEISWMRKLQKVFSRNGQEVEIETMPDVPDNEYFKRLYKQIVNAKRPVLVDLANVAQLPEEVVMSLAKSRKIPEHKVVFINASHELIEAFQKQCSPEDIYPKP